MRVKTLRVTMAVVPALVMTLYGVRQSMLVTCSISVVMCKIIFKNKQIGPAISTQYRRLGQKSNVKWHECSSHNSPQHIKSLSQTKTSFSFLFQNRLCKNRRCSILWHRNQSIIGVASFFGTCMPTVVGMIYTS